ncbi:MAG: purine-binding chemotaxis protein CheW [Firmicutes bacterium]|nr:purine-binding chemotaxis protein CheW [Bacillota bacterium]
MDEVKRKVDQERQLVIFRLYGEEFGVEITKVREIVKPREITRLPNVVDFVEGVTNLRGEVIPIIDLKKRFGVEATDMTDDSRIIIVDISDNRVGLIVDDVTEVLRISDEDIDPPPRTIAGLKAEYIQGIGKVGERLLILLDVDKILTTEERIELQTETLQEELVAATAEK